MKDSIIDNINLQQNTARMIGNAGSNDLNVYQYGYGLIFVEHAFNYFPKARSLANNPLLHIPLSSSFWASVAFKPANTIYAFMLF